MLVRRPLGASGAETAIGISNIAFGQTEALLVVGDYVKRFTRSEYCAAMALGMSTISGSILGLYVSWLSDFVDGIAGHLFAASVCSFIPALMVSKILVPENDTPETAGHVPKTTEKPYKGILDVFVSAPMEGLKLAAAVVVVLISFPVMIDIVCGAWSSSFTWLQSTSGWDLSAVDSLQAVVSDSLAVAIKQKSQPPKKAQPPQTDLR